MRCVKCGFENPENQKHCQNCKSELFARFNTSHASSLKKEDGFQYHTYEENSIRDDSRGKTCYDCGFDNKKNANFCEKCSSNLNDITPNHENVNSKSSSILGILIIIVTIIIVANIFIPDSNNSTYANENNQGNESNGFWYEIIKIIEKPSDYASYEEWDAYFNKYPEAIMEELEEMEEEWDARFKINNYSDYASEDSNDSSWGDVKPDDDASYEEWDAYFKKHPEAIMEEIEEMEDGWGN